MEARISDALGEDVARVREWGRTEARPAGLEADRNAAPLPVDHPFFLKCLATGRGKTSWKNADREDKGRIPEGRVVRSVVLAEELAYWDRGIGVATPGVGLRESIVIGSGTEEQKERFLGPFMNPERPKWASFDGRFGHGGFSDAGAPRRRSLGLERRQVFHRQCQSRGMDSRAGDDRPFGRPGRPAGIFRRERNSGSGRLQNRKEDGPARLRIHVLLAPGLSHSR